MGCPSGSTSAGSSSKGRSPTVRCSKPPGTGLTPATPRLGSTQPHRDWAYPSHTETGLTPATSAPGLGSPRPHLHRHLALACPHLRLNSPSPAVAGVIDLALSDRATVPPCEYSQYRCVSTRSPRAGLLTAPHRRCDGLGALRPLRPRRARRSWPRRAQGTPHRTRAHSPRPPVRQH